MMLLKNIQLKLPSPRRALVYLHSWLGAIIFAFLLLITITGLIITFSGDLIGWEYPELVTATPSTAPLSPDLEALISVAQQGYGEDFDLKGLMMPHSRLQIDAATFFGKPVNLPDIETMLLAVDPYQHRYLRAINLDESWTVMLIHLHGELLAGHFGELVVAVIGLLTLALLVTGIYLWLPQTHKTARAIKNKATRFRWSKNPHTFSFYVHSFLGLWGILFVMTWVLTGVYWSQPQWFKFLLPDLPRKPPVEMLSQLQQNCGVEIKPNQALKVAQQAFPDRQLARLMLPTAKDYYYSFAFKGDADSNRYIGNAFAWVSSRCEHRVYSQLFGDKIGLEKLSSLMISWHSGRFFGVGQIPIVLFAGFILALITLTGIVLWYYRHARHLKSLWHGITRLTVKRLS
ncbi:putative iron-regulated membrane protein [Beggiatoa alba B18LD]|uniref:Putative iron-regulated membrane protein n=1 Tax=Beggiatoa alba B18LD TaxID=395493 RepID=I3CK51_9GAMM|nr:PepSY-associated TM helix domain-containing protein [Beggiatoa alba]EIJ43994.1 putative iron-regulated membrane protein [Beggiatoa alba B18LD]